MHTFILRLEIGNDKKMLWCSAKLEGYFNISSVYNCWVDYLIHLSNNKSTYNFYAMHEEETHKTEWNV